MAKVYELHTATDVLCMYKAPGFTFASVTYIPRAELEKYPTAAPVQYATREGAQRGLFLFGSPGIDGKSRAEIIPVELPDVVSVPVLRLVNGGW